MYKAKNGFTLLSAETPDGWTIRRPEDIILYLTGQPYFSTVATPFLWEALEQAAESRKEYADVDELAAYIAENYI